MIGWTVLLFQIVASLPNDPGLPASNPASTPVAASNESSIRMNYQFGKGLSISSGDEQFKLVLRGRMQFRAQASGGAPGKGVVATEMMIRRARVVLSGHAFSKHLQYTIQLGFAFQDMEADLLVPLRDAYITQTSLRDLSVRAGQMKVPFDRQRVTSSGLLEFADRSLIINELSLDRDVGVYVFSNNLFGLNHWLGYRAGVFAGDGRNRFFNRDGLLFMGRLIVTPLGIPEDDEEGDLQRRDQPLLQVAGSFAFNDNSARALSTFGAVYRGGFDYTHAEADLNFKWHGVAVLAEFLWRQSDRPVRNVASSSGAMTREFARSAVGFFVQAGVMVYEGLELGARYSDLRPLPVLLAQDRDPSLVLRRELGGAASYYFSSHQLKLQADYFYLFGVAFGGGSHVARLQMQLAF